jgi:putative Mn2+ efflux pump MntP
MDLFVIETLGLAVGLGADAMSVCTAVGVRWHGPRQKFRLAWHMGLFQFLMPILGWLAGRKLASLLADYGRYVAAALVIGVGAKMLYEALKSRPGSVAEGAEQAVEKGLHVKAKDPTRGWSLVMLAVATSIDALVVGFSLGLRGGRIWQASIVIGLVAGLMALIGVELGRKLGAALGKRAEAVGAIVLIGLGAAFFWL